MVANRRVTSVFSRWPFVTDQRGAALRCIGFRCVPRAELKTGRESENRPPGRSHGAFLHPAYVHRSYFGSGVPVKRARFVVDAPEDVQLNFKVFDAKVVRKEVTSGGRVEVTYEGGPYPAFEALEDALPPDVVRWPNVAVAVGTNWQELARKYEDVVEKALSGIDFESTVAKIVSRDDAPRVKATKILQWVKDRIRYVGVEFGDSAIVPYTPDKTLARGFGDCK